MRGYLPVIRGFLVLALAVGFTSAGNISAVDDDDTNAKIKAIFLYNFTKYVEWPSEYKQGEFKIGILGKSALTTELQQMALKKKVGTQSIVVTNYSSVSAIQKCHMIYIPPDQSGNLGAVVDKVSSNSTLIIADKAGSAKKGAAINFVVEANKQRFELNLSNALKHNLKVSSNLSGLAIVVE